jgi:hypothetical protein
MVGGRVKGTGRALCTFWSSSQFASSPMPSLFLPRAGAVEDARSAPAGLVLDGSEHGRTMTGEGVRTRAHRVEGAPGVATRSAATIDTRRAETQSGSAAPQAQESVTRPAGGGRPNPPRAHLQVPGRRAPN